MKLKSKLLFTLIPSLALTVTGCGPKAYKNKDYKYLLGLCETCNDLTPTVDEAFTADWISGRCGALGVKTFRIWINLDHLYEIDDKDNLKINANYQRNLNNLINKLKEQGVERFSAFAFSLLHLKKHAAWYGWAFPDPITEYEDYFRTLQVYAKAFGMLAKDFPDINYFEPLNEPDHPEGSFICKNGYVLGSGTTTNMNFMFTDSEIQHIMGDVCYYVREAVREANPNNKVLLPAICNFASSPDFLDQFYKAIKSGELPTGTEKSYRNPDDYFDIINVHPYQFNGFEIDDDWVDFQKEYHNVTVKNGDGEKPFWYTEFGFTDYDSETTINERVPKGWVQFFDAVKKLKFVETVLVFKLTNNYNTAAVAGEDTYGIFYNPDDPIHHGDPKPAAKTIYHYFYGDDADESVLYIHPEDMNND